jgi:DeoR/GlpR family transcriptional regulator of sugar metabolism
MSGDARVRMLKLAQRLFTGGAVSSAYIRRTFDVSHATAKRDLVVLEQTLPIAKDRRHPHNMKLLQLERRKGEQQ